MEGSFVQHGSSHDTSPPRTPPSQLARPSKSKGVGGVKASRNRPALRDAFGDQVREAERDHTRNRSNSHELSWSPNRNTRASVVDNMLASLDQFSTTTTTQNFSSSTHTTTSTSISHTNTSDPFYSSQSYAPQLDGRSRSHTVSSTVSSDFSFHADSPKNRGHRSNSSSNFQSSLGRIDSVRLTDEPEERGGRQRDSTATAKPTNLHGGGRKGSKSSTSSSVDFGTMGAGSRWQRGADRRSASFDHGYARPAFAPPLATSSASPLTVGQQETMFYDSLDAAPTPTVPVGPRRNDSRNVSPAPSGGFRPGSALSGNQPAPMRRRASIRSPMAIFQRPDRSEALEPGDPEKQSTPQPSTGNQTSNNTLNTSTRTPEKAQGNAYRNQLGPNSNSTTTGKEKERPGFFKRVFGSSRNYPQPLSHESTPSHSKHPSAQNNMIVSNRDENTPPSQQHRKATRQAQAPPLQKASTGEKSQPREQPPHPLNKKTSFFRRRKKSVSEASVPVPPLQLQSQWQNHPLPIDQSPVSSLRQVMDPYLNSPTGRRPGSSGGPRALRDHEQQQRRDDYFSRSTIRPVHAQGDSATIALPPPSKSLGRSSEDEDAQATESDRSTAAEPERRPPPPPQPQDDHVVKTSESIDENKATARPDLRTPKKVQRPIPSPVNTEVPKRTSSTDWKDSLTASRDASEHVMPKASPRLWIEPDASDEDLPSTKMTVSKSPVVTDPKASVSTLDSDYQSANSKQQSPTEAASNNLNVGVTTISTEQPDSDDGPSEAETQQQEVRSLSEDEPTEDDRLQAEKLFTGESSIPMGEIAAWLGEIGPERARVRTAYMDIFDWHHMSILTALRSFCSQLRLKGESQQVDRLLDSLSTKWCQCNPDHGFKATDVVHTICYSLLLLNTDLHLADIEQKMTRSQFIRNTIPTIRRVVLDAAPDAFPTARASMLPPPKPSQDDCLTPLDSPIIGPSGRPTNRLTTRPSDHSGNEGNPESDNTSDDCGPLVKQPFNGRQRAWEEVVEVVLKNFYSSIRQERLPLVRSEEPRKLEPQPSSTSLSAGTGGFLRRSNSMLSKAGSESLPARGRLMDSRMGSRWSSKGRSRPRLPYQASLGRASRTSIDDDMSAISPSASSMWSKYSLGKTQTSMSVNSYSSDYPPRGDYQRSIGFANALSQAIIREDASGDAQEETMRVVPLLEDESLELAGAPWAKEGMLKHKHHLESVDKKSKDRNWNECFAVVDKGWMRLFSFNMNARSMRQKARNQKMAGGVVGGGNWTENAESMGKFSLRQTIASALPPPGYSRARPHVFALSLPNGAVHLFQAGTPEIVREFVSSANYWSARMSKEPLVGGVSNIEYGWSDAVINLALLDNRPPSAMTGPRPSLQNSIRSSIDQANSRPKLPGDRIQINDWTPPTVSMMESQLLEVDQLRALSNYVKNIEEELSKHNELRPAIALAFSPRHPNAQKAMNNWERKSSYLLREIVKFRTYIDCLQQAQVAKEKIYKERDERESDLQKMREADIEESASKGKGIEAA